MDLRALATMVMALFLIVLSEGAPFPPAFSRAKSGGGDLGAFLEGTFRGAADAAGAAVDAKLAVLDSVAESAEGQVSKRFNASTVGRRNKAMVLEACF